MEYTIIPNMKKRKFLGFSSETYTLVVTDDETVFAKLTSKMLKDLTIDARAKARSDGKGFFGRWGAQMGAALNYSERYKDMPLDDIKAETPENFSLTNQSISRVHVRVQDEHEAARTYYYVTIYSSQKHDLVTEQDPTDLLKKAYGSKVS